MSSDKPRKDILEWGIDIGVRERREGKRIPSIAQLVNNIFVIEKVEFYKGNYGDYAIVRVEGGEEYRTSSRVLIEQLKVMEPYLIKGHKVRVKLVKVKRYYTFAPPVQGRGGGVQPQSQPQSQVQARSPGDILL